jgi:toxin ParE1/3/4
VPGAPELTRADREAALGAPVAEADLIGIYEWIVERANPEVALRYLDRVETFLRGTGTASERGHLRSDVRPNLRILGFERRLIFRFMVGDDAVTIQRVFRAGRDWESVFADGDEG